MSQNKSHNVLFATSIDVNLDKGWSETKTNSGSKADLETIYNSLLELYSSGLRREIAGAIKALADLEFHHPFAVAVENPSKKDLSSEKLRGILDLWNPFDLGDFSKAGQTKPDIESIRREVENDVVGILAEEPLRKRRARSLLQALGIMDVDFVQEHRPPVFRSWGQRPQVDTSDYHAPILLARQCSECRHCIRSFHYYQCRVGCVDNKHPRNMAKMPLPKAESDRSGSVLDSPAVRNIALTNVQKKEQPYLLCPTCLSSSPHPRDHLRAVRGFTKGGDTEAQEFARELDTWEDHLDGTSLVSVGAMMLDKVASSCSLFNRSASRDIFPAGNSHYALMFGPLLFENGATTHPGGALMSLRNIPTSTACSSQELRESIAERYEWQFDRKFRNQKPEDRPDQVLHTRLLSVAPDRRVYEAIRPLQERRWISLRRQVSGGALTGYCEHFHKGEDKILSYFLSSADKWNDNRDLEGDEVDHRDSLNERAFNLTSLMLEVYGDEINKFLRCFADRLHRRTNLEYNRLTNNCQDFCNSMLLSLKGDKWDTIFRSVFPEIPPDKQQDPEHAHLRYMMSFAGKIVHPMHEGPFVHPLASSVPLYNAFGNNDADLVDHISSIRLKVGPEGFGLAESVQSHDDYLLKDARYTCPWDATQPDRACTLADHLLDGPHDNLSLLTFHVHRSRELYTTESNEPYYDIFLPTDHPKSWLSNRLEVLSRLLILNTCLARISHSFQNITKYMPPKQVKMVWSPPISMFARAWHSNVRQGKAMQRPTWPEDIRGYSSIAVDSTLAMIHTHPFMQEPDIWKTRLAAIKRRLFEESKKRALPGVFEGLPWKNCECEACVYTFSRFACSRAESYARSLKRVKVEDRIYEKSHPDFVDIETLRVCMEVVGEEDPIVVGLRE